MTPTKSGTGNHPNVRNLSKDSQEIQKEGLKLKLGVLEMLDHDGRSVFGAIEQVIREV